MNSSNITVAAGTPGKKAGKASGTLNKSHHITGFRLQCLLVHTARLMHAGMTLLGEEAMSKNSIHALAAMILCLLACAACTPNATDLLQISGYDVQGSRTGSYLPSPGTMTPY